MRSYSSSGSLVDLYLILNSRTLVRGLVRLSFFKPRLVLRLNVVASVDCAANCIKVCRTYLILAA